MTFIDQKLETLRVTPQANGDYRVDKQSGDCEILREQDDSGRYLVEEMHAPKAIACSSTGCHTTTVTPSSSASAMNNATCSR